jgi:hypothetical protein
MIEAFPDPEQGIAEIIDSSPQRKLKTRSYYIKGTEIIEDDTYFFYFVRSKTLKYHDDDLQEKLLEDHPYIHVLINKKIGICAIEVKTDFSKSSSVSADLLSKLFLTSAFAKRHQASINIDPIRDPEDLISYIRNAAYIRNFFFEVRHPNASDAADFSQSLKRITKSTKSQKGKASFNGLDIDKEITEDLVRSSASTGDDAGAILKMPGKKKLIRKSLGKNYIHFEWAGELKNLKQQISQQLKEIYYALRHEQQ